jgi:hypothetical protein
MANGETFGVKNTPPPKGGTNIKDLIRFTTGGSNKKSDLENALRNKGYREKDVRRMGRAFTKIQNNPDRNFLLHGDGTFSVEEGGQGLRGSGRQKGNVKGFDVGDVIGLGNDISRLAGAMQGNIGLLEEKRENDKALADRIVENDKAIEDGRFDLLTPDGFDLNPDFVGGDPINTTPKTKTKSPTVAEAIQKGVYDPTIDAFVPADQVGKNKPSGKFESNVFDPLQVEEGVFIDNGTSVGSVESNIAEDPGLLAQIAFGSASGIKNSALLAGASNLAKNVYQDPDILLDNERSSTAFEKGLFEQKGKNDALLQKKIQASLAGEETNQVGQAFFGGGRNSVQHEGATITFDDEGNITRRVVGGVSPFDLGILTPTGAPVDKVVKAINKPFQRAGRAVANKFSKLFKGNSAPTNATIDDYFKAIEKIRANPNITGKSQEAAMRATSEMYKDVIKLYNKSRVIMPKTGGPKGLSKITDTGKTKLYDEAVEVADRALLRKQAQDVADKAIRRQKVLGKADEATRSAVPTNTIGSQFSSSTPLTKFTNEIKALEKIGRKRGVLADGTRVRLKGKVWEIYRHGGKTKFSR